MLLNNFLSLLKVSFLLESSKTPGIRQGCGVGAWAAQSQRFLGGVGVGLLTILGVGVGVGFFVRLRKSNRIIFCTTP